MYQFWRRKYLVSGIFCIALQFYLPGYSQESADEFSTFQEPSYEQNFNNETSNDQALDFPAERQNTEPIPVDNSSSSDILANEFPSSESTGNENNGYVEVPESYIETSKNYNEQNYSAGPVSYEKTSDLTLPYKQRRKTHGILFSINYEDFYPSEYISIIDQAHIDRFLDGSAAKMFGAEIGYKYNFSLGSLAFLFQYAKGGSVGNKLGYDRSLEVEKMALSANYSMDLLLKEPYLVPYIQGSISNFDIREDDQNFEGANAAHMVMGYRIGLLFQLDWIEKSIDPRTHEQGLTSSGLQNTYLDVYVNNYMQPSNVLSASNPEGEANVAASMQLGLGLKMEF